MPDGRREMVGVKPPVEVRLLVEREAYERFVSLIHNLNAIKNAGDPDVKASIKGVRIRG